MNKKLPNKVLCLTKKRIISIACIFFTFFFAQAQNPQPNEPGNDRWIGYVYDNTSFGNYKGYIYESEEFRENYGNFSFYVTSSTGNQVRVTASYFSARFFMKSSKRGLYRVKIVTDDGAKLFVDDKNVFDAWFSQGEGDYDYRNQLFNLKGNSVLKLEFHENTWSNVISFREFTKLIENVIVGNQKICKGSIGTIITGDDFGSLPAEYEKVNGTGFKWYYRTLGGNLNLIPGATSRNFTPSNTAPFNTVGKYYVYRKATLKNSRQKLDGTNNNQFQDFTEENISEPVLVEVIDLPNTIKASSGGFKGTTYCEGETDMKLTYNAENDNAFPYTITYFDETNQTTHTQVISGQGSETFTVGTLPITGGTHRYILKSIKNKYGCKRTDDFKDSVAEITIREKPSEVLTITKNINAVCVSDSSPIITLENSDSKNIIVTYKINNGTEQTIEVDNTNTISVPTNTAGFFTYEFTKVKYKSKKYCEEDLNDTYCFAVFPKNDTAPTVNTEVKSPIVVTSPTLVTGFVIEYSFDDGVTWGANTPPTTDKCEGYKIKTRYKLTATCAGADLTLACATSPATTRVLDDTPPTFTKSSDFAFCVENIKEALYSTSVTINYPDYYTFKKGSTEFDLNTSTFSDNCCTAGFNISWLIKLDDGTEFTGIGQPSTYANDIQLLGDGTTYQSRSHTIKYIVEDCYGNKTEKTVNIVIKPRPKIED